MFSKVAQNRAVQQRAGSYAAQTAQSDHVQQHMAQGVASAYHPGGGKFPYTPPPPYSPTWILREPISIARSSFLYSGQQQPPQAAGYGYESHPGKRLQNHVWRGKKNVTYSST